MPFCSLLSIYTNYTHLYSKDFLEPFEALCLTGHFMNFRKGKKLSQGHDRQKHINNLLNASHNSQAERDFLRERILQIFQEDERNLQEDQARNNRSKSLDDVGKNASKRIIGSAGIGSDDLQSRQSLHFIDVVNNDVSSALVVV